jgi:hypothetical protein
VIHKATGLGEHKSAAAVSHRWIALFNASNHYRPFQKEHAFAGNPDAIAGVLAKQLSSPTHQTAQVNVAALRNVR